MTCTVLSQKKTQKLHRLDRLLKLDDLCNFFFGFLLELCNENYTNPINIFSVCVCGVGKTVGYRNQQICVIFFTQRLVGGLRSTEAKTQTKPEWKY
jgi:hypothetical protein